MDGLYLYGDLSIRQTVVQSIYSEPVKTWSVIASLSYQPNQLTLTDHHQAPRYVTPICTKRRHVPNTNIDNIEYGACYSVHRHMMHNCTLHFITVPFTLSGWTVDCSPTAIYFSRQSSSAVQAFAGGRPTGTACSSYHLAPLWRIRSKPWKVSLSLGAWPLICRTVSHSESFHWSSTTIIDSLILVLWKVTLIDLDATITTRRCVTASLEKYLSALVLNRSCIELQRYSESFHWSSTIIIDSLIRSHLTKDHVLLYKDCDEPARDEPELSTTTKAL